MYGTVTLRPLRFALVAGYLALVACGSAANTVPAATTAATGLATEPAVQTTAAAAPALSFDYSTLPQSQTAEGYWVLGEPDAPILMQYYSDFL